MGAEAEPEAWMCLTPLVHSELPAHLWLPQCLGERRSRPEGAEEQPLVPSSVLGCAGDRPVVSSQESPRAVLR